MEPQAKVKRTQETQVHHSSTQIPPQKGPGSTLLAGDAPSVSVTHELASAPPDEEQANVMDVDQTPGSLVSPNEDDLLTGATDAGVEGKMASFTVSTPER